MTEVAGRLITDLHPNGTVRMVFIAHVGGGYERPHTVKSLDIAEGEFINTLGFPPICMVTWAFNDPNLLATQFRKEMQRINPRVKSSNRQNCKGRC